MIRSRCSIKLAVVVASLLLGASVSQAQCYLLDKLKIGHHSQTKQDPVHPCFGCNYPPATMVQFANCIDILEEGLRDDGVIVIQQPSVWGQARMTLYRKDFENQMQTELNKFVFVLSAAVARTDQATLQSQTTLGMALSPGGAGGTGSSSAASTNVTVPTPTPITAIELDPNKSLVPLSLLNTFGSGGKAPLSIGYGNGSLGVEPPIYLDEKKRYLDHLNEIRRINMGDDNADSAGYGLYLVRMPVSIDPGAKTHEGYGGILTVTAQHEFSPFFLQRTFRNLVINDLVDQLTPIMYQALREGESPPPSATTNKPRTFAAHPLPAHLQTTSSQNLMGKVQNSNFRQEIAGKTKTPRSTTVSGQVYPIAPGDQLKVFFPDFGDVDYPEKDQYLMLAAAVCAAQSTVQPRSTDIRGFLLHELESAYDLMERGIPQDLHADPNQPNIPCFSTSPPLGDPSLLPSIANNFHNRQYCLFSQTYVTLKGMLNQLPQSPNQATLPLCWAIAVEAALLNEALHEDIVRLAGCQALHLPSETPHVRFYLPRCQACGPEGLDAEAAFEAYVRQRWPLLTFAIDPVVDQQNIADAYSRTRELQLSMAFALATGQINFNRAMEFQRRLQYDAETIALNRTVVGFSHGQNTFGWKFMPRYQTPPDEKNNVCVAANMLWRGGPGRDYGIRHSRLEPAQRELTAIIVMPSFLNQIRVDVSGNWFKLARPDEMRITTARQLELGRWIKELEQQKSICDSNDYRPDNLPQLLAKLEHLEQMLPLQTHIVPVPYENTLGGFALFGQGHTALVPELIGYDGIDIIPAQAAPSGGGDSGATPAAQASITASLTATLNPTAATSQPAAAKAPSNDYHVVLYGKHFSINETTVIVGGQVLRAVQDASGNYKFGDVDILSREVMHVRIPAAVLATAIKKGNKQPPDAFVEFVVATPNGLSNRLLIPFAPKAAPAKDYVLKTTTFVIGWRWKDSTDHSKGVELSGDFSPSSIEISKTQPDVTVKAATASIPFSVVKPTTQTLDMTSMDGSSFKASDDPLTTFRTNLFDQWKEVLQAQSTPGVFPIQSGPITFTTKVPAPTTGSVDGQLSVTFIKVADKK